MSFQLRYSWLHAPRDMDVFEVCQLSLYLLSLSSFPPRTISRRRPDTKSRQLGQSCSYPSESIRVCLSFQLFI